MVKEYKLRVELWDSLSKKKKEKKRESREKWIMDRWEP